MKIWPLIACYHLALLASVKMAAEPHIKARNSPVTSFNISSPSEFPKRMLWYAPGWEDVTAQYIGGDALSCYRSTPSGERCRGDREAAGCTLGQCIPLAYKMAA